MPLITPIRTLTGLRPGPDHKRKQTARQFSKWLAHEISNKEAPKLQDTVETVWNAPQLSREDFLVLAREQGRHRRPLTGPQTDQKPVRALEDQRQYSFSFKDPSASRH